MNTFPSKIVCLGLIYALTGCTTASNQPPTAPTAQTSSLPTPAAQSPAPIATTSDTQNTTGTATQAIAATLSEIQKPTVFVRPISASQETKGHEGMSLSYGEQIRTTSEAMAQIDLKTGLAFRLGNNSVLTLRPDNRLNLASGTMITWVEPGKKVPTEIVTPSAVAAIRGTTVYVEIPKDPTQGTRFFTWEGEMAVRLAGQSEEVMLKTAEEVWIRPGEQDMKAIRKRVRRMPREEWRAMRRSDRLLRSFKRTMPTLKIIDTIKPGQVRLNEPIRPFSTSQQPLPKPTPTPLAGQQLKARLSEQSELERLKQAQTKLNSSQSPNQRPSRLLTPKSTVDAPRQPLTPPSPQVSPEVTPTQPPSPRLEPRTPLREPGRLRQERVPSPSEANAPQ
jgi:hypothetical protein